jgi:hypothetical protein
MRNAIATWRSRLSLAVAIAMLSGCGGETIPSAANRSGTDRPVRDGVASGPSFPAGEDAGSAVLPSAHGAPVPPWQADMLRVRTDVLRNRLWVLGLEDVKVYDLIDRTLLRRIALPPWSVARGVCMPDLVLDRSGSAFIASNAQPTLFRIDASSFAIEEREIRLRGREEWSIGFGALGFDAKGDLHGLIAFGNSMWRIDFAGAVAEMIDSYNPPLERCALATYAGTPP